MTRSQNSSSDHFLVPFLIGLLSLVIWWMLPADSQAGAGGKKEAPAREATDDQQSPDRSQDQKDDRAVQPAEESRVLSPHSAGRATAEESCAEEHSNEKRLAD